MKMIFADDVSVHNRLGLVCVGWSISLLVAAGYRARRDHVCAGHFGQATNAQTTVSVKFNAAQLAGDLNVVVVGWNDSAATVRAVTDTVGNAYTRAVGPTVISGVESQAIYYARTLPQRLLEPTRSP